MNDKKTEQAEDSEIKQEEVGSDSEVAEELNVSIEDLSFDAVDEKIWSDLVEKYKESKDGVLRATADFENSRKRIQKRSDELVKYANESFLQDILPVMDDMDRAIESLDKGHDVKTVQQGLHMVQNTFHKIMEQNGIEAIESIGKAFDPNLHEAVGEVESNDVEDGHVIEEVQKGYLLNGRLARPSRVKIAKHS